ncbi:MAG: hypothetical protein MZW92_00475 [Comamonadaceae bacterium]|nr:hypothetical protein [Comamonadaceae bacterium]
MMKLTVSLLATLFATALHAAPATSSAPATAVIADGAPKPDSTPRLAYGFLLKHGDKLVSPPVATAAMPWSRMSRPTVR